MSHNERLCGVRAVLSGAVRVEDLSTISSHIQPVSCTNKLLTLRRKKHAGQQRSEISPLDFDAYLLCQSHAPTLLHSGSVQQHAWHLCPTSIFFLNLGVFINCKPQQEKQIFGRAASGGAIAPLPAACHRRRTRVPTDYSQSFSFLSPPFWRSDVFFWRDRTSIEVQCLISNRISFCETSDLRSDVYSVKKSPISKKGGKKGGGGRDV